MKVEDYCKLIAMSGIENAQQAIKQIIREHLK